MTYARSLGAALAGVLAVGGLALAGPVQAQTPSLTFVGETGGDDVSLLLAGATFSSDEMGLRPVFGLTTYLLAVDGGNDTDTDYTVQPWVGLRNRFDGGFLQAKVGYSWKSGDDEDGGSSAFPFYGGSESGVSVGGHLEYWGDGSMSGQAIASYNTASSYLWTRGRALAGVMPWSGGNLNLGAELGWQGELDDDVETVGGIEVPIETYEALQFGPVLQWASDGFVGTLHGGWKQIDEAFGGDTWYFGVEFSISP